MSFNFERALNYPLAGATGYDCDDTLIAIRCIEQNKNWISKNCSYHFIEESWNLIYNERCSTYLNKNNINMRYIGDAILLACLEGE